jgi:hypothetical protein
MDFIPGEEMVSSQSGHRPLMFGFISLEDFILLILE